MQGFELMSAAGDINLGSGARGATKLLSMNSDGGDVCFASKGRDTTGFAISMTTASTIRVPISPFLPRGMDERQKPEGGKTDGEIDKVVVRDYT